MARTENYALALVGIASLHEALKQMPTVDELAAWFRDTHEKVPSRTTLSNALKKYRAAETPLGNADAAAIAMAQTIQAQADARAEARLEARRATLEQDARDAIASAEHQVKVIRESADKDIADAERRATQAELEKRAALDETHRELSHAHERIEVLTKALLADKESIARLETQRTMLIEQMADAATRALQRDAASNTRIESLETALTAEKEASSKREQRSASQFSESSRLWGNEIALLREKVKLLEVALLAAKGANDEAVRTARREMSEAIATEIKKLAEAVGGVNVVHNTHMSGQRTLIEALLQRVDLLATAVATATKDVSSPSKKLSVQEPKRKR
jgi:hypothetical protein